MAEIPLKTVKRILRRNVNGDVSKVACIDVIEFCEYVLKLVAEASLRELNKQNEIRKKYHLPELKRIPPSIYKKILMRVYKSLSGFDNGDVGDVPLGATTTLSKDAEENRWYYA